MTTGILSDLREQVVLKETTLNLYKHTLQKREKEKLALVERLSHLKEARGVIQKASQITQKQLSINISKTVTHALAAVFDDPYEFKVDFISRRNTTECDLWFVKNSKMRKPLVSCGYGPADVASFALRISYWDMIDDARNFMAVDEPFRNLSLDNMTRAGRMIEELHKHHKLQFLIVTHNKALAKQAADKIFTVSAEDSSKIEVTYERTKDL